jgi:hypothetical protein
MVASILVLSSVVRKWPNVDLFHSSHMLVFSTISNYIFILIAYAVFWLCFSVIAVSVISFAYHNGICLGGWPVFVHLFSFQSPSTIWTGCFLVLQLESPKKRSFTPLVSGCLTLFATLTCLCVYSAVGSMVRPQVNTFCRFAALPRSSAPVTCMFPLYYELCFYPTFLILKEIKVGLWDHHAVCVAV